MKKLWLRWLALVVFVLVLGAVFIRLGEWQLHRLEWRRETNARITAYANQPAKPYSEVFNRPITDAEQWQKVTASGTFDGQHQFLAMYRDRAKASGVEVITPLKTDQGEWLLVDRGFVERAKGANENIDIPAAPTGRVTVEGYVRRSERGKPVQVTPVNQRMRLINSSELGKQLPYPVVDGYLGATSVDPPQDAELLPMQTPELTEGPHLSYAVQWFCFTAIAAIGCFVLIRADLRDRKKEKAKAERLAAEATEEDNDEARA